MRSSSFQDSLSNSPTKPDVGEHLPALVEYDKSPPVAEPTSQAGEPICRANRAAELTSLVIKSATLRAALAR